MGTLQCKIISRVHAPFAEVCSKCKKVLVGRVSVRLVKSTVELPLSALSLVHPNFTVTNFSINRDDGTYICLVDKASFAADQVNL